MELSYIISASLFIAVVAITYFWHKAKEELAGYRAKNSQLQEYMAKLEIEQNARIAAETEVKLAKQRLEQHQNDLEKTQEQFKLQFETLANKIFDEKSNKFQQQSSEKLTAMLTPLRERISEFQKKVDETFVSHTKEQISLKTEIKKIVETNEKMTLQAESLAKALKGDVKAQGNWGEIILEKILEESGLRKEIDYVVQGTDMGLKHHESGGILKPDIIVNLPENKHIVIDSKVSLTHYERFYSDSDEKQKILHLRQFISSIKSHISGLEQKRYQDTSLNSADFVLMFMPIEGAYSLAIQSEHDLLRFAWDKKIVIVCPSTLFATLKTVSYIRRLELQNRNVTEIARRGGALHDKIVLFVNEMQKLGKQIESASDTYKSALNKLATGQGNIIRQTEQLRELGAKASKTMPKDIMDNESGETGKLESISI